MAILPRVAADTLDPGDARRISAEVRPLFAARMDKALAELAAGQHGVLTLAQLQAAGLSPRGVRHRAATGRLTKVQAGIYAVGPTSPTARWMAAVLACGPGAVLSHRSAAALWGIGPDPKSIDVMVRSAHSRIRPGITAHRVRTLCPSDIAARNGLPCTSLARTLLDLAAIVDPRTLERAIDRAETLRVFDLAALHDVLRRNRRRHGTRALTAMLADYAEPAVSRNESEERLLALVEAAGLPRPRVNAWIGLPDGTGYEADFLWPKARLIAEVDGRTYHARRRAFTHDRQRDRRLALAGFETRRYAASELVSDPERVAAEIRAFLERGGFRP